MASGALRAILQSGRSAGVPVVILVEGGRTEAIDGGADDAGIFAACGRAWLCMAGGRGLVVAFPFRVPPLQWTTASPTSIALRMMSAPESGQQRTMTGAGRARPSTWRTWSGGLAWSCCLWGAALGVGGRLLFCPPHLVSTIEAAFRTGPQWSSRRVRGGSLAAISMQNWTGLPVFVRPLS